ncbi:MAG: TrkA family potassium uptake protein [Chloroflexaceae bacterium]|nr:TrkA family potassium uptake protein [Chloroflexaceae bacterium]
MPAPAGKKEFAVIGLGRFGQSVALTLIERGYSVLGIDHDREIVQRLSEQITQVAALDATDEEALRAVDIASFDTVVVAIGENFEGNLMTTVALKALDVRYVVCKTTTERQRRILLRVGADHVVLPEHDAGRRLAHMLTGPGVLDLLELEPGYSITELRIPRSMVGHTLIETNLRHRFGVTVLVIKREQTLTVSPSANYMFASNDLLVVLGKNADIARLSELT